MRTLMITLGGFIVLAVCLGAAKLFTKSRSWSMTGTVVFVTIWIVVAVANLWIGVFQAGYSLREEMPIFLLIFLLPASFAAFLKWKIF